MKVRNIKALSKLSGSKFGLTVRKYSPEIKMVVGIIGTVGSTVIACKATLKAKDILDEHKANMNDIHEAREIASEDKYTTSDYKKDVTRQYVQTGMKIAKAYAPAVALGTLSIGSIVSGNVTHRKRNTALAASYLTLDNMFKKYRANVVENFGETVDRDMRFGIKTEEVSETVVDEKGKEKTVKKTVDTVDATTITKYSDYARIFDSSSKEWEPSSEYNLTKIKATQNYLNNLLVSRGYVFLNEAYEQLGLPISEAGQSVGWIYDPTGEIEDGYIEFGVYDVTAKPKNADFINGYENVIILDFNVDGDILHSGKLRTYNVGKY